MHYPVLLAETLEYLAIRPDGVYVDATAGLGGHTGAIAAKLTTGTVISVDRDQESLQRARENTQVVAERIRFVHARFSELSGVVGEREADGLLADLGVSRFQLTDPERGFSLMSRGPVDMRMSRTDE